MYSPHILCLTEHHTKLPEILQVNLNYTVGASFCRKNLMHGWVRISVRNSLKFNQTDTVWSNATHIKIFIDGCNSLQFIWINKHTFSLWLYKKPHRSCHVITCSHQSVKLSYNSQSARMSFSQVQWVFIVKHYLASCSYLTCQNEFKDTFFDHPVPN
jgi:hypothetical protein